MLPYQCVKWYVAIACTVRHCRENRSTDCCPGSLCGEDLVHDTTYYSLAVLSASVIRIIVSSPQNVLEKGGISTFHIYRTRGTDLKLFLLNTFFYYELISGSYGKENTLLNLEFFPGIRSPVAHVYHI